MGTTPFSDIVAGKPVDRDEATQRRLLNSLGVFFGQPVEEARLLPRIIKDEPETVNVVATEATVVETDTNQLELGTTYSEPLAAPSSDCPPFTDPCSVRIADQASLDFELEEPDVPPTKEKKIHFFEKVSVVEIPSYRDLDQDTIDSIWTSVDQVYEEGERNTMEYIADGCDWRNAREEHQMVYDRVTGELYHPATWREIQQERRAIIREYERIKLAERLAREKLHAKHHHHHRHQTQDHPKRRSKARNKIWQHVVYAAPSLTRFADT
jgi:hypothetical protein